LEVILMKRKWFTMLAFSAGILAGLLLSRPFRIRAQANPQPSENDRKTREIQAAKMKAEAWNLYMKAMDEAAAENDANKRDAILRRADYALRLSKAAGVGWIQTYKVDFRYGRYDYGETSFITEQEIVGFACAVAASGGPACFVAAHQP
jgi:hypothetical protein